MVKYLKNLSFYALNNGSKINIKNEHVKGRGFYGYVGGFNFKNGNIIVSVFDYGMYFPREYSVNQLDV